MNDPFDHDDLTGPPASDPTQRLGPGDSAQAPQPHPPAPQPTPGLHCHHCHSDLSGVMLGGSCPMCGAPITAEYYYPAQQQSNGMAVSAMVLGIISSVSALPGFCCGCLFGVSGICGILAIIFYFPAMHAVNQQTAPPRSRNMAIAGLVCGILGLAITFGYIVLMIVFNF